MTKVARGSSPAQTTPWRTGVGVFLVALVFSWYFVHLRYRLNQEFPLATLQALIDGTAHKPFQFRMLVPWIVGALSGVFPVEIKTLYKVVDVAALMGLFYAFRLHLKSYFEGIAVELFPFALFYVLPWNYLLARDLPVYLPYDLAAVAFFALGLALLHRRKWIWYYPVFALATFNRETMLFLAIVFAVVEHRRLSRASYAIHLAAQVAIWLAIKFVMGSIYAGNPGTSFEFTHVGTDIAHWRTNLEMLATPQRLILFLSSFGFVWILILAGWKRLHDPFTRQSLWAIPPFVLMILLIGNLNEMRVYGELTPIVLTAALLVGADLLQQS
ncbi:MAG: hypothetical protein AB1792_01795 [Candidatus Zixiibacteriota bacterium]